MTCSSVSCTAHVRYLYVSYNNFAPSTTMTMMMITITTTFSIIITTIVIKHITLLAMDEMSSRVVVKSRCVGIRINLCEVADRVIITMVVIVLCLPRMASWPMNADCLTWMNAIVHYCSRRSWMRCSRRISASWAPLCRAASPLHVNLVMFECISHLRYPMCCHKINEYV